MVDVVDFESIRGQSKKTRRVKSLTFYAPAIVTRDGEHFSPAVCVVFKKPITKEEALVYYQEAKDDLEGMFAGGRFFFHWPFAAVEFEWDEGEPS